MQWMISHQQARRNLTPGKLIYANSMVADEIALENKEKQLEGTYKSHETRRNGSVQMDGSNNSGTKKPHTSPTHTREQVAKMAGVGTGTIARYDAVMKSDVENSKLRALISNNFGRRKNDPSKDRKALATYVELNGYKNGELGNGRKKDSHYENPKLSLDEIAKQLSISKANLTRALSLERNLTDSMKELLDDGVISKTLASDVITSLSEEEQKT